MMRCLREYFPEGTKWTEPDGDCSPVQLPEGMNSAELLKMAVQPPYQVAFVSGEGFLRKKAARVPTCSAFKLRLQSP